MTDPANPQSPRIVHVAIGLALRPRPRKLDRKLDSHSAHDPSSRDGVEVLITRRPSHTVYGGFWEFPGGKIHDGETPAQCLVREFLEEVALHIEPTRELPGVQHIYPHAHVHLHPFECRVVPGQSDAVQHLQVTEHRWVAPADLRRFAFPEANLALLDHLTSAYK